MTVDFSRTLALICLGVVVACAGPLAAVRPRGLESQQEAPKLVILMVVDQMRGDFLEHYGPALTGGLRRLMDRGYTFERATHNHARTSTGPGTHDVGNGRPPGSARSRGELLDGDSSG